MSRLIYIGLGAQKAGTSWIYKCLRKLPKFQHGFAKEYHTLSALNSPESEYSVEFFRNRIEALKSLEMPTEEQSRQLNKLKKQLELCSHPDRYFDYFSNLLEHEHHFSADFSPSYSALNSDTLLTFRQNFRQRGVKTKAIFVMREPVCRLESAIRMKMKNNSELIGSEENRQICIARLKKQNESPYADLKSNYQKTVTEIDKAFDAQNVFFGFYETFFSTQEQKRFCDFLGVESLPLDSGQLINSSKRVLNIPVH